MIRLFVGLQLPESVRQSLAALARPLPRTRWVDRENIHLTLRFIGEVDDAPAADIDDALARVAAPAFDLSLAGVGAFNSRGRVRTLWVGVEPSAELHALYAKVEQALVRAGQPPEGRRYSPHVTLARLRDVPLDRVAPIIAAHGGLRLGPIPVARLILFSSVLGRAGPVYTREREYPLAGGAEHDYADLAAEWEAGED